MYLRSLDRPCVRLLACASCAPSANLHPHQSLIMPSLEATPSNYVGYNIAYRTTATPLRLRRAVP
jgi:hypothetical protein